jgi:hypothetical protein
MEVKLVVQTGKSKGREIAVRAPEFLIGRAEGCHLRPGGPSSDRISRKHCALRAKEGRLTVVDFNSTNHTFVNGQQVVGEHELKNGDRLLIGGWLEFEVQMTVNVSGKKKPKVNSIQEAAARTVQTAPVKDDDVDLSSWLEGDDEEDIKLPSSIETMSLKDTNTTGHKVSDTTTIASPIKEGDESEDKEKKDKMDKKAKVVGQFDRNKKPTSESSQSAATDMLRQFFNRKK